MINTIPRRGDHPEEAAQPVSVVPAQLAPDLQDAPSSGDYQAPHLGLIHGFLSNSPDCVGSRRVVDHPALLQQRSLPMKKLVIAGMLAAFAAAVALPAVIGSQEAVAAQKKKSTSKLEKEKKKKPTGGM